MFDYGYFNDVAKESEEIFPVPATTAHSPILVAKDKRFGSMFAQLCQKKGTEDPYIVLALCDYVLGLGVNRVKIRSDGEPALRSMLDALAQELKQKI